MLKPMLDMLSVKFTCTFKRHWFQALGMCRYACEKPLNAQHSQYWLLKMLSVITANIAECT